MFDSENELENWLEKLLKSHPAEISLGLNRVLAVAEKMGLPIVKDKVRLTSKVIVVAGTNGKGSVCAFVENILLTSGYQTTLYTSPHILSFKERFKYAGKLLEDKDWVDAFKKVEKARLKVPKQKLTFFEFSTLAAILLSEQLCPDVAIFEIGLGGRLDAVNLLDNDCAVLTSIDYDHESYLGTTREQIAWEKSHVARPGKPIIIAEERLPETVTDHCLEIGAKTIRVMKDYTYKLFGQQWTWFGINTVRHALPIPALRGMHQLKNASAALACFEALSNEFPLSQALIRKALVSVSLPARFQVLPGQPMIILDVAHNLGAARTLSNELDKVGFFPKTIGVVGMLDDKDSTAIFEELGDKVDKWFLVSLSRSKSMNRGKAAKSLKNSLLKVCPDADVLCFENPEEGFKAASRISEKQDRIVVFGSFYIISAVWKLAEDLIKDFDKGKV